MKKPKNAGTLLLKLFREADKVYPFEKIAAFIEEARTFLLRNSIAIVANGKVEGFDGWSILVPLVAEALNYSDLVKSHINERFVDALGQSNIKELVNYVQGRRKDYVSAVNSIFDLMVEVVQDVDHESDIHDDDTGDEDREALSLPRLIFNSLSEHRISSSDIDKFLQIDRAIKGIATGDNPRLILKYPHGSFLVFVDFLIHFLIELDTRDYSTLADLIAKDAIFSEWLRQAQTSDDFFGFLDDERVYEALIAEGCKRELLDKALNHYAQALEERSDAKRGIKHKFAEALSLTRRIEGTSGNKQGTLIIGSYSYDPAFTKIFRPGEKKPFWHLSTRQSIVMHYLYDQQFERANDCIAISDVREFLHKTEMREFEATPPELKAKEKPTKLKEDRSLREVVFKAPSGKGRKTAHNIWKASIELHNNDDKGPQKPFIRLKTR